MVKHRIHRHMCENACIITHLLYLTFVYHKHDKHNCNVIHVVVIKSENNSFVVYDGIVCRICGHMMDCLCLQHALQSDIPERPGYISVCLAEVSVSLCVTNE